ncbi:TRAP transporter small permease [Oligella urethralis]|uniref:TRAP transporter small permease n=1 Tax=Oligella urethralis TaxID=90245 RepID=UPI00036F0383|nr:TRAP transporter small permease subunit [Oligella urethralis]SUA68522.1 TRAP-type C4-dicarboxylate transport system, small permease component [Oligella urethralis]
MKFLKCLSSILAKAELRIAGILVAIVTALIVINVFTRAANMAIFWIDEAAIFFMVWAVFLGTAVLMQKRQAIAVTIVKDFTSDKVKRYFEVAYDWSILIFSLFLLYFCWIWYRPDVLIETGFNLQEFSMQTMNFIYQDTTNTLGIPKYLVWLIIPYFGFSCFIHSLANILTTPCGNYAKREAQKEPRS